MLQFVLGRAGSGKTTMLREKIKIDAQQGKQVWLIVPEQFTFETERNYYENLGAGVFKNVQVTSFTRLAHQVFKEFGGTAGDYADDSRKLVLMNMALFEIASELTVYDKMYQSGNFAEEMVSLVEELKNADLSYLEFETQVENLPQGRLKEKARDISLIFSTYEAFLSEQYKDSLDDLSKANEKIKEHHYFSGAQIYLDEFKGFTAREHALLKTMLLQGEKVVVSLCMDPFGSGEENSVFYSVHRTFERLRRLAQEEGIPEEKPICLRESRRFALPELAHLEQNLFQSRIHPFSQKQKGVSAYLAANEYEETDLAAAQIRTLVEQEGLRYRDIVVVSRDLETYRHALETSFEKYEIPYYIDSRKDISLHPLIRFVTMSLEAASGNYPSDKILSLLKCGVTPFTYEEVSFLENYVYLWSIKGEGWLSEFTYSIYGVSPPRDSAQEEEQRERLALLNRIRVFVTDGLKELREKMFHADGYTISQGILSYLKKMGTKEQVEEIRSILQEGTTGEELELAREYRRVWELIGEAARLLAQTLGRRAVTPKRYLELFSLVIGKFDLGTIPQTLDSVTAGSAERIRTDCPKAVFILGVNDKVFPYLPSGGGVFTDREREILLEQGLELSQPVKEQIKEERFIAYKIMTAPTHFLILSARKGDVRGASAALSYLFPQLRKMFGEEVVTDKEDMDSLFFCKSPETAFSMLAHHFREDTSFTASLRSYFERDPVYASWIEVLFSNLTKGKFRLERRDQTIELFGRSVLMSPTRVEQFHQCKFRYFCEQGLHLQKRERVQLNPLNRGTVVHHILYQVCRQITDYSVFDGEKVRKLIQEAVDETVTLLGGYERQSKRFLYLYRRIQDSVYQLVEHLFEELSQSKFRPSDFEYEIGKTGNMKPYTFHSSDGITIQVQGTIDRIDRYQSENGKDYVRVIDYKTGTKDFRLADILNGLNLQMFLYLMCLEKNGAGSYRNVTGAGALYLPASEAEGKLSREAGKDEQQKNLASHYRMKGIILNEDQVMTAMEPGFSGIYTPLSVKAKAYDKEKRLREDIFVEHQASEDYFDSASMESLLTQEQLELLFRSIEGSLEQMVKELYGGNIEAKPLVGPGIDSCAYCDYQTICRFEETDPVNEYQNLKKKEIFDLLRKEQQDE